MNENDMIMGLFIVTVALTIVGLMVGAKLQDDIEEAKSEILSEMRKK